MKIQAAATLLLSFYRLAAVRGHEHGEGESVEDYARRHVEFDSRRHGPLSGGKQC